MTNEGKPSVVAEAALTIEAAELLLRDVLNDVMEQRNTAPPETRGSWISRMAHAVFLCRGAVQDIVSVRLSPDGGFVQYAALWAPQWLVAL